VALYLRRPAFPCLDGKQRQHSRRHVVVAEIPFLPSSLSHHRRLPWVLVLEKIAPGQRTQRTCRSGLLMSSESYGFISGVVSLWSQGGHGGLEHGSPPAGSSGEVPRSQIFLRLSNAFLRRFVAESVLHLPYALQKILWICANPMTQHGRDRMGTCPRVPTRGYAIGVYEGGWYNATVTQRWKNVISLGVRGFAKMLTIFTYP